MRSIFVSSLKWGLLWTPPLLSPPPNTLHAHTQLKVSQHDTNTRIQAQTHIHKYTHTQGRTYKQTNTHIHIHMHRVNYTPPHKTQVAQPLELGIWTWPGHLQATLQTIMTPQTSPCKSIVKHKLFTPMYYN